MEKLLLLRADPADALDLEGGSSGFFGDLAILLVNERPRGLVTVQSAEKLGRHAAVGANGVVFIDDVEKGKFAFGIGAGFFGHARLLSIRTPLSNEIAAIPGRAWVICPSGKVSKTLSSRLAKNFQLVPSGKSNPQARPSRAPQGAFRDRHER